ncbi:uncharacterized protein EV422DRAFT_194430 [Fimicolochytrium jonesii]|uniref:uncharacterized protein n=1 Tax=Fimicolochytrium jonesii TaxID=1396493 RepID=UPI0022FE314C|nr:uncharacterized protein EV422DRAFT_194430 [Fimicolochytrium jonesii]KAI8818214.1 hypothetical protein EV422DRAFT_194430 [Fimicolochytrium jonesii]
MFRTRQIAPAAEHVTLKVDSLRPGCAELVDRKVLLKVNGEADQNALKRRNTRDSAISISSFHAPQPQRQIPADLAGSGPPSSVGRTSLQMDSEDPNQDDKTIVRRPSLSENPSNFAPDTSNSPIPDPSTSPSTPANSPPGTDPEPTDRDHEVIRGPWKKGNMQNAWNALSDDDVYASLNDWRDPAEAADGEPNSTFSMQTVNPRTRRWGRTPRVGPLSSARSKFRRSPFRRACLIATFGLMVVLTAVVVVIVTIKQNKKDTFDPNAGPRGQLPSAPPGPPLPVINLLGNRTNPDMFPNTVYFGASIDWSQEDPQSFNAALGRNAAIIDGYYNIGGTLELANIVNSSGFIHPVSDYFNWTAGLVGGTGAIMGMTVMPYQGLANVSLDAITQLGLKCAEINQVGIPIMLRFAPEMNGNWYPWGQSPSLYKRVFQQIATIVRNATNQTVMASPNVTQARTAMVWSPVPGLGYPFVNGNDRNFTFTPLRNTTRWAELDTNNDTRVDEKDDPYLPYYPGDEFVDWIGVTALFNTSLGGSASITSSRSPSASSDISIIVPPGSRNATLATNTTLITLPSNNTSSNNTLTLPTLSPRYNVIPPTGNTTVNATGFSVEQILRGGKFSIYRFAERREKPFVIGETGIGYLSGGREVGAEKGPTELDVKSAWWAQLFNKTFLDRHPLVRAVVWYDYVLSVPVTVYSPTGGQQQQSNGTTSATTDPQPTGMTPNVTTNATNTTTTNQTTLSPWAAHARIHTYTLDYSLSRSDTLMRAFTNFTDSTLPRGLLVFANESSPVFANTSALGLTVKGPPTTPSTGTMIGSGARLGGRNGTNTRNNTARPTGGGSPPPPPPPPPQRPQTQVINPAAAQPNVNAADAAVAIAHAIAAANAAASSIMAAGPVTATSG